MPPTIHTSPGPLPHTPVSVPQLAGEIVDGATPSKCTAPWSPTNHTSSGPLAHTAESSSAADGLDQPPPIECRTPLPVVIQTSSGATLQTPVRPRSSPVRVNAQEAPSQCTITSSPSSPTTPMSLGSVPCTPEKVT